MRSEFPGLLYCAGALIAVTSWALFMFSKEVHRKGRTVSILRLPVIWILFLVSSAPALASYPVFEIYSGSMDPDVLDFYSQPFIRLLPAATCIVNLCVSACCSMALVSKRRKTEHRKI
ncbi:hypothetical protein DWY82_10040 [Bifidobacterium longum]|nr:hypothetical protein DWY82_10040 [Bifidobacterium longum]RGY55905.1 hypothetical protein DXA31_01070 [Bifidobacterium longum]